jgi:hypothetical protein
VGELRLRGRAFGGTIVRKLDDTPEVALGRLGVELHRPVTRQDESTTQALCDVRTLHSGCMT